MVNNQINKNVWRLIESSPLSGPENMAIDEAILVSRKNGGVPSTLRLYSWRGRTLSFGYFQEIDEHLRSFCNHQDIVLVRRPTGGGLVLHDQEITFSVIFGRADLKRLRSVVEYYRIITECFQDSLNSFGLDCQLEERNFKGPSKSSFCFNHPTKYDLLVQGKKICGSAQRRDKEVILQQGSLILGYDHSHSAFWGQACGLREFIAPSVTLEDIYRAIIASFEKKLQISLVPDTLTTAEAVLAARLMKEKYA